MDINIVLCDGNLSPCWRWDSFIPSMCLRSSSIFHTTLVARVQFLVRWFQLSHLVATLVGVRLPCDLIRTFACPVTWTLLGQKRKMRGSR
jgi:hypothetical protein